MFRPSTQSSCRGCAWCTGSDPVAGKAVRKDCQLFYQLKKAARKKSYLATDLRPSERNGFAAAGVLPFVRLGDSIELLVARQPRGVGQGKVLLDFLGGKRNLLSATPKTVAIDKFDKETGGVIARSTIADMRENGFPLVLWAAKSKYCLFLYELTDPKDTALGSRKATAESKALEWVSRNELEDPKFVEAEFHHYAAEMISEIEGCNVLDYLEELFDCAAGDGGADELADLLSNVMISGSSSSA